MPERLKFDVGFGRTSRPRDAGDPMRLLVVGDFRGTAGSERPPLPGRPTQQVDLDTFDDVMRRLAPRLNGPSGEIGFSQIDDFHPDRLYARLDLFQALREKRANPPADLDDLFGRLLGKPPQATATPASAPATGLDALIHKIVAPHIVKDTSAQTQAYVAAVDAAIAEQMRALLHDAAFQSLEAAWRGVHWLISRLELDENLQLHVFDVSRDELLADVVAAKGQLAQTGLHQALVDRWRNVPGGQGWSAIAGLYRFGPSDADIGLLAALGLIASQAGAPFLGDADLALVGNDDAALSGWHALRRSEAAPWIALAAPRVLLRLPYGKRTDAIESFALEEFVGEPVHAQFLWGHASLAMALLIGRGFTERGWDMEPGDEREIGDLPAYTFTRDGERELQPCGERLLTEKDIQTLIDAGLVAIASRRDRNAVVAIRFQSISDPPAPLVWYVPELILRRLRICVALSFVLAALSCAPRPAPSSASAVTRSSAPGSDARAAGAGRDWPVYLGHDTSNHYSTLKQITKDNVAQLQVAWTYDTGDKGEFQTNNLVIDGVLYTASPTRKVIALDAATGKEIWRFDPTSERSDLVGNRQRGLVYWASGDDRRIFTSAASWLYALDARTGRVVRSFGDNGSIHLGQGMGLEGTPVTRLNTPGGSTRTC